MFRVARASENKNIRGSHSAKTRALNAADVYPWRLSFSFRWLRLSSIKIYTPCHAESSVTLHRENLTPSNELLQRIVDAANIWNTSRQRIFYEYFILSPLLLATDKAD